LQQQIEPRLSGWGRLAVPGREVCSEDLERITRTWLGSLRRPELRGELDARMGWYVIVATIPIALLWKKSRSSFIVSVGLAYAVAVGAFQLVQGTFLPVFLRVLHSVEIAADSFVYAAILGFLFVRYSARCEDADVRKSAAASV